MKKLSLLLAMAMATGYAIAQDWLKITYDSKDVKGIPFQKVRIKKSDSPGLTFLFAKDHYVYFSEKPDGIDKGYYAAHSVNGFVADGSKKNKIEIGDSRMKRTDGGWYEYDFGKTLYIRKVGLFVKDDNTGHPIYILPTEDVVSSNINSGSNSNDEYFSEKKSSINSATTNQPLKLLTPRHSLIEEGWKLAKTTKTEEGWTCECYVKEINDEEDSLFTYKKGNGEFITEKKDKYGSITTIGDYNWFYKDGGNILRQGNCAQRKYPNGVTFQWISNNPGILYLPENSNVGYKLVEIPKEERWWYTWYTSGKDEEFSGYLINDRLYYLDSDVNLIPYMQKIKGKFFIINPKDTIVDVKYVKDSSTKTETFEAFYKNGDHYKMVNKYEEYQGIYQVATLHRMDGILKITKKNKPILTKADGSILEFDYASTPIIDNGIIDIDNKWSPYTSGGLEVYTGVNSFSADQQLCFMFRDDPIDWNGVMTYTDGKKEKFRRGKSETYWNNIELEKKKAEEAKKKAELAKERNPYIKKWGFYPGDYKNYTEIFKTGRPFGAIKEYYGDRIALIQDQGTSKQYKFVTLNIDYKTITIYFWVRNGKITSVIWR